MLIGTDTPFMKAVLSLFDDLDKSLPASFTGEIEATLVGGAAVHLHTGYRVSDDTEAIFSRKMLLPSDLVIHYVDAGGARKAVHLDTNYSSSIALLHPDYEQGAQAFVKRGRFKLKVLSPLDLAVTKIGRFLGNDADDIVALTRHGLLSADEVEERAREAIGYYIGDTTRVEYNLRDALELIRSNTPR